ncbi:hypothetical protein PSPO01_03984 [Paraphaeosphaeria sporulosa]
MRMAAKSLAKLTAAVDPGNIAQLSSLDNVEVMAQSEDEDAVRARRKAATNQAQTTARKSASLQVPSHSDPPAGLLDGADHWWNDYHESLTGQIGNDKVGGSLALCTSTHSSAIIRTLSAVCVRVFGHYLGDSNRPSHPRTEHRHIQLDLHARARPYLGEADNAREEEWAHTGVCEEIKARKRDLMGTMSHEEQLDFMYEAGEAAASKRSRFE